MWAAVRKYGERCRGDRSPSEGACGQTQADGYHPARRGPRGSASAAGRQVQLRGHRTPNEGPRFDYLPGDSVRPHRGRAPSCRPDRPATSDTSHGPRCPLDFRPATDRGFPRPPLFGFPYPVQQLTEFGEARPLLDRHRFRTKGHTPPQGQPEGRCGEGASVPSPGGHAPQTATRTPGLLGVREASLPGRVHSLGAAH